MSRSIAVITYQFSVVVKSLEKGLREQKYEVSLIEDDMDSITMVMDSTDVYIIYLQDSILGNIEKVKTLFLICDTLQDHGRKPILIGSDNSRDAFMKVVPALKGFAWVDRPVNMHLLMKTIEKEGARLDALNAKKRILIIDDDPLFSQMVCEWIKNDYEVSKASDGMQGISWLANNKVDLILLDYEMPVVDGAKVLEMLRLTPATASIPVIFLTGVREKTSIERVVGLKPQGYVLKSTPREGVLKTLSDFFEKHGK